ncbi:hypothetical protein CERSUDRAFT_70415 [Gelatoporia subvermispora B]|uniref:Uncharacterized protein n=1 Tax=Ceriporiopsis subvermispora (strain B) TaxID=914234 RepID=M2RC10_CERS8|nr:hypothetical protein CERSUDRAFT_70415 [Gelatoporia subvermispora B]
MSRNTSSISTCDTRTDGLMDRFLDSHSFAIPTRNVGRTIYTRNATLEATNKTQTIWASEEALGGRWTSAGIKGKGKRTNRTPMRTIYFRHMHTKTSRQRFDEALDTLDDGLDCSCGDSLDGEGGSKGEIPFSSSVPASDYFCSRHTYPFYSRDSTPDLIYSPSATSTDTERDSDPMEPDVDVQGWSKKTHVHHSDKTCHDATLGSDIQCFRRYGPLSEA